MCDVKDNFFPCLLNCKYVFWICLRSGHYNKNIIDWVNDLNNRNLFLSYFGWKVQHQGADQPGPQFADGPFFAVSSHGREKEGKQPLSCPIMWVSPS